ncbi:MAG TPA: 23S rRNA (guanosine(2251)-2'-O)-methyltransferase RlmB [Anaerolineales bacterium]|nr:23S rRNA (guanosine(2251)-2'-O)-methyltransferase RlmB [Anaerolineales bacterium]
MIVTTKQLINKKSSCAGDILVVRHPMNEFIYSRNAVYEALAAEKRSPVKLYLSETAQEKGALARILQLCQQKKVPIEKVNKQRLEKYSHQHQGVVLETKPYPLADLLDILNLAEARHEPLFVLLLDSMQDPVNFGSLIRTAEAVGVHGVVIPLAHAVEVTPAVVNASSGATEHLLIARENLSRTIDILKENGAWIVGLDEDDRSKLPGEVDLSGPIGIVVGSEGEGIRQLVRGKCDYLLRLPMKGKVGSLNASVAGSTVLYLTLLSRK